MACALVVPGGDLAAEDAAENEVGRIPEQAGAED